MGGGIRRAPRSQGNAALGLRRPTIARCRTEHGSSRGFDRSLALAVPNARRPGGRTRRRLNGGEGAQEANGGADEGRSRRGGGRRRETRERNWGKWGEEEEKGGRPGVKVHGSGAGLRPSGKAGDGSCRRGSSRRGRRGEWEREVRGVARGRAKGDKDGGGKERGRGGWPWEARGEG